MPERIVVNVIGAKAVGSRFFYGWVIVGVGMLLTATNATVTNSFGVFFKPLARDFGWSRAETSLAQSISMICLGVFAIATGWLADRFGRSRVLAMCSLLTGAGLLLTSQISALWQIYLTFAMTGIGLSSTFAVTGIATALWFRERRGLALGLTSAGMGLGNFIGVPMVARLIEDFGWSRSYAILGTAAFLIIATGAYFLRRNPESVESHSGQRGVGRTQEMRHAIQASSVKPSTAIRTKTLWLLFSIFCLYAFANYIIIVHIVNYATDIGIAPLVAATLVSGIGLSATAGRILMGGASDRIGGTNALLLACVGSVLGLILLLSARELWMLYLFTVIYGFSYGAEVPQQTALVGRFFGLRTMLVGIVHSGAALGAALGSWSAGWVFDVTRSYQVAFLMAIMAIISVFVGTLLLRRMPSLVTKMKVR